MDQMLMAGIFGAILISFAIVLSFMVSKNKKKIKDQEEYAHAIKNEVEGKSKEMEGNSE